MQAPGAATVFQLIQTTEGWHVKLQNQGSANQSWWVRIYPPSGSWVKRGKAEQLHVEQES